MTTLDHLPAPRRRVVRRVAAVLVTVGAGVGCLVASGAVSGTVVAQSTPTANDWLGIVNVYRAQSGLSPVTENPTWSAGGVNHSCWMMQNDIAHDETPGTPGYTVDGDAAGNSGNVAVSTAATTSARSHIDLWMTGPFHAIGLLRAGWQQTGYGQCSSPPNPTKGKWRSAGTLDVIRGINRSVPRPATPIVFPGNGVTTSLSRFIAESPDPRTFCGWGAQSVGLPLIALMPGGVSNASAVLNGPAGPVTTCVLTRSNTTGVAQSILGGDNAVVVVPAAPLATGSYSVSVASDGGTANWSFSVDPTAPLAVNVAPPAPLGNTAALTAQTPFQPVTPFRYADSRDGMNLQRLPANQQVRVPIAGRAGLPGDITAISANFTGVGATAPGYLTASNCAEANPAFSTLNYRPYEAVPNQAIIPLDRGEVCLFSDQPIDVIIDINGYVSPGSSQVLIPVVPKRLYDSRGGQALLPGEVLRVDVEGGASPAPDAAVAVAVNLTGVTPAADGFIRAFPCDVAEPSVSSLNPVVGHARANSAIIPTAADGTICLTTSVATHVLIDLTGWFGASNGKKFIPLQPLRLADTRQSHPDLNGGAGPVMLTPGRSFVVKVAGARGIPADARAATLNVVALGGPAPGFLTVVPCASPSDVSNVNYPGFAATANGATVMLDGGGQVCITASTDTHIIVDVTGVWK